MVVQTSKAVSAKVITTVGSAEKESVCKGWGADHVINYKIGEVAQGVRQFTGGRGVDVWYETQREPDFTRTFDLMAKRGRMVLMAGRQAQPVFPVGAFYPRDLTVYGFAMFNATAEEQRLCAEDINRWLGDRKLHPVIGRTFPLAQAADAHRLQEENTLHKSGTLTGKIIVTP
jgi:NADPH2:quinone reductase